MPKFDHRFDSMIQRKEDIRFSDIEEAEDYAQAQCSMYGAAQNIVPAEPGLLKIIEHPKKLPQAVRFIEEMVGQ